MADVLILGGGFGGLAAATELRALLDESHQITLIDRSDAFYMGFAKLWDLGGIRPLEDGTRSLDALEARGIRFLRSEIRGIDPTQRSITTDVGEMHADALLVALGGRPSPAHLAWLDGPQSHNLYDGTQLEAMKGSLDGIEAGRVVVAILGAPFQCPPAPFEAAFLVDERLRRRQARDRVEVVVSTPQAVALPAAGVDASAWIASHLGGRDIRLMADHGVSEVSHTDRVIRYANGAELAFDVLLGVPAMVSLEIIAASGLAGPSGWIEPDRLTLRTAFDGVYAVGDGTHIPNAIGAVPKAGVFAAGEGVIAAHNIAADLGVGEPARFDGHGGCFLELPDQLVAIVQGDFYADPPDIELTEATRDHFDEKVAFERERLSAWLG